VAGSRLTIVVGRLELDDAGRPDYRWLDRTTALVGEGLARGGAVLYDGMLAIGDTRRRFGAMLERSTGLRMGQDFGLAFSPERSRPGHVLFDLRVRPKIVGAVDDKTRTGVMDFLQLWIDSAVMGVESVEAAEYIPLVEAAARHVNAALALEFAALARTHGLDVHAALTALDTQTAFPVCRPTLLADGPEIAAATRLLEAASSGNGEAPTAPLLCQSLRIHDDVIARTLTRLEELGETLDGKQVLVLAATDTGDSCAGDPAPGTPLAMLLSELRRRGAAPRHVVHLPDRGREAFEIIVVVDPRLHFAALELETFPRCRLLLDGVNTFSARRVAAAGIRHVAP
jgi:UDP-N-acetyl-D-mannosaminuronate dehydrogenase